MSDEEDTRERDDAWVEYEKAALSFAAWVAGKIGLSASSFSTSTAEFVAEFSRAPGEQGTWSAKAWYDNGDHRLHHCTEMVKRHPDVFTEVRVEEDRADETLAGLMPPMTDEYFDYNGSQPQTAPLVALVVDVCTQLQPEDRPVDIDAVKLRLCELAHKWGQRDTERFMEGIEHHIYDPASYCRTPLLDRRNALVRLITGPLSEALQIYTLTGEIDDFNAALKWKMERGQDSAGGEKRKHCTDEPAAEAAPLEERDAPPMKKQRPDDEADEADVAGLYG